MGACVLRLCVLRNHTAGRRPSVPSQPTLLLGTHSALHSCLLVAVVVFATARTLSVTHRARLHASSRIVRQGAPTTLARP